MGRLAELFEKKANGSISNEELKEFEQLQKEAKALADAEVEKAKVKETGTDDDAEKEVDRLAQRFADSVTDKFAGFSGKMDKVLSALEQKGGHTIERVTDKSGGGFIVDPRLGKKSVAELAEIKIQLPDRKQLDKRITEISMKTVHFVQALMAKNVEKLQILSEGTAADGGYLVPEEFANMIVEDARDQNIMRQIAAPPITISGDTFHLPSLASRPRASFRGEKAVKQTSTAQFGENVFTPYSLAVIVPLSNELVADASLGVGGSIVNYVARLMSTSIAEREEQAFWVGTGSNEPSGVDSYTLRTVAAAGSTDTQRADAIVMAFQRTPQGYRNRAVWVGNSTTWESVGRLKDSQNRYLLTDLASSPTQTLRGRPVYESNHLPGGTLFFGDYSYYQIVDREGMSVRISDEATVGGSSAFEKNLTFVRVEKRVDAELTLAAAITEVTGLGTP